MKVLLINDTTKWYHFGCTATSIALIESIKKLGHSVTSLPITETYKIKSAPLTKEGFLDKNQFQEFVKHNPDLINIIKQCDSIVFNGEGTLHGINPAPVSLLYLAYIAKMYFGKHVEILNHSAYPQHDTSLGDTQESSIYKLVYETIDFAAIREPISFNTMKALGVKTGECFDCMPLYIRDHYIKSEIKLPNQLLIAGSATWLQLNIPSDQKGNIEDFTEGLSGFNLYLQEMSARGYGIKFLYGADSNPAKDDREFIEYMKINFQNSLEVYEASSLDDWLKTIEESTLLVSGRFHHTIAAASLGTHFIALNSNTPKIEGLMQILGLEKVIRYNDKEIYSRLLQLTESKLLASSQSTNLDPLKGPSHLEALCVKAEKNFDGLKKNDLGIAFLAGTELLEAIPLVNYFFKEIIGPLLPFDSSAINNYIILPSNKKSLITAYFTLASLGYCLLSYSNPKISFVSKVIYPLINTAGYALKLVITEKYQEVAKIRLNNKASSVTDDISSSDLFSNCFNEVVLSSTTAFISSLPAAISFAPSGIGISYFTYSTISAASISLLSCASSNNKIIDPDNSISGKILPFIGDAIMTYSLISQINFGTLYSLPEVAMALKKSVFTLSAIVLTDQTCKAVVEIIPNMCLEYIDFFLGLDFLNTHNE